MVKPAASQSLLNDNQVKIDSLLMEYKTALSDTAKATLLGALATEYSINDFETALDYGHQSLILAVKTGLLDYEYSPTMKLGDLYFKLGLLEQATQYFTRHKELANITNSPRHKIMATIN